MSRMSMKSQPIKPSVSNIRPTASKIIKRDVALLSIDDKAKDLLVYAKEKRKNGPFNDINIQIDNEKFPCNKMVLSCYSAYFESMFQTEMQLQFRDTVAIKGFNGRFIRMLIDYMYGETVEVDNENVLQLLALADYLKLRTDAKEFCFEFLKKHLKIENCLDALSAHSLYMAQSNPELIYQFITKNFDEVLQQERFKNMPPTEMARLLKNLKKNEIDQELMFSAVAGWVSHSKEDRQSFFPTYFQLFDLSKLSLQFLVEVVSVNPIVTEHLDCLNSVVAEMSKKWKYHGLDVGTNLYRLGGKNRCNVEEVYKFTNQNTFPDLPANLGYHTVEKFDNFIYCIGGEVDESRATSKVYRLNLLNQNANWLEVDSMNEKRYLHGSCMHNGKIVVSGGFDGRHHMRSVEVYKLHESKWRVLQSMNNSRNGHGMVTCNDIVYAIGGNGDAGFLSSVEILRDLEGKWKIIEPMNEARHRPAAVSVGNAIYVMGGHLNNKAKKSVEKYDTQQKAWFSVSSMKEARLGPSACVFHGKIYVVGGEQGSKEFSTLECFDPSSDKWTVVNDRIPYNEGHAYVIM